MVADDAIAVELVLSLLVDSLDYCVGFSVVLVLGILLYLRG
jgi:hypothetical protein